MIRRALCLALLSTSLSACDDGDEGSATPALVRPGDGLGDNCHPLRPSGVCGLPYPSSAWEVDDAATKTGRRLSLPSELIEASAKSKVAFDPTRWNLRDGFSPATPVLAFFPDKLDAASLPSQDAFEKSVEPTSATLLLDLASRTLLPHFSELDESADIEPGEQQPLMLRPARHLEPDHHYAVAITRALRTQDGKTPARPPGFSSALAGARGRSSVERRALAALPDVVDALDSLGVDSNDLLVAWDFHTASLDQSTKNVLALRDRGLPKLATGAAAFTIVSVEDSPNTEIEKRIRGTFRVPSFLSSDDRTVAETELVIGSDGLPAEQRMADYPFELVIPKSAVDKGPLPLLVYGHGLLGAADQVSSGHVRQFCNDKGYVCVGTDWIGLSEKEEAGIGQSGAAIFAIEDLNHLPWITDRLQQSLLNFMALTRVAKDIALAPQALLAGGKSALAADATPVYYGISQGGIMGTSLLAYSPDIERGVVQVGGSAYSLMIQRSVNWVQFFPTIRNAYPNRVTQQLLMALWQPLFDDSEGSGTAFGQGVHPPLPNTPDKHLLMQIAVGDCQVSNLAAEIQARTIGLPLLSPSAKPAFGLEPTTGGAQSAMAYWDLVRAPPPETNATPTLDNDVHADIRKHPLCQKQTDDFLRSGKAENPCNGPCSFPGFAP